MVKFLLLDDDNREPIFLNVDHIIAANCCNHEGTLNNARIDFVVRDFETCSKHELVEYSMRANDQKPNIWLNRFSVLMMGRYETARAALYEALTTPGEVVDLEGIASRHGGQWCDDHPELVGVGV